jgi:hypothetical protein
MWIARWVEGGNAKQVSAGIKRGPDTFCKLFRIAIKITECARQRKQIQIILLSMFLYNGWALPAAIYGTLSAGNWGACIHTHKGVCVMGAQVNL